MSIFHRLGAAAAPLMSTLALSSTASPEALTPEQEAARRDLQMQSYARWTFWAAIGAFVGSRIDGLSRNAEVESGG